jgi:hypothetical protein
VRKQSPPSRQRLLRSDPLLRVMPWRIFAVFHPIERVLDRMERDGTVDAVGGAAVFREPSGWYDLVAAIEGVIDFHRLAEARHRIPCQIAALERLAKKLNLGAPLFQSDIDAARADITACKRQAAQLRLSQATDIIETVRIQMELDRLMPERKTA